MDRHKLLDKRIHSCTDITSPEGDSYILIKYKALLDEDTFYYFWFSVDPKIRGDGYDFGADYEKNYDIRYGYEEDSKRTQNNGKFIFSESDDFFYFLRIVINGQIQGY